MTQIDKPEEENLPLRVYALGALMTFLGALTVVWTKAALTFDFGQASGLRMFAFGGALALNLGLIALVISTAWTKYVAKREAHVRGLVTLAAIGGYLVTKLMGVIG